MLAQFCLKLHSQLLSLWIQMSKDPELDGILFPDGLTKLATL